MLILILACFGCIFVLIDFHLVTNYYSANVAQSIRDLNYKCRQLKIVTKRTELVSVVSKMLPGGWEMGALAGAKAVNLKLNGILSF